MNYWLFKSEPNEFSIDDLAQRPEQTEPWDGVRNYQARNMMRDQMRKGDLAFFYHSNTQPPGIIGIVEIVREAYPDPTAFDSKDKHYDPKSDPAKPRWFLVEVKLQRKFKRLIALNELREQPELAKLSLVQRGNRLSVMSIDAAQWQHILSME
jgi:predicted RNA-binding protein with PUA-like domain